MGKKVYIVEPRANGYAATISGGKRASATSETQQGAADRAHKIDPNAVVVAARVRKTSVDNPDHFRRIY
jgi:hypothetical protein